MKKPEKIFAVVLVCLLAVAALVACVREGNPAPNTDYDEAQKNLEDNNYTTAAGKNGEASFETVITNLTTLGISADDMDCAISANKQSGTENDLGDGITIVWFKTEDAAKAAHDTYKKYMDTAKKQMDAIKSYLDTMKDSMSETEYKEALAQYEMLQKTMDNTSYGVYGKVFWTGTTAGIKATK